MAKRIKSSNEVAEEWRTNDAVKVFMRQVGLRGIMARDQYVDSLERLVAGLQEKVNYYEKILPACCLPKNDKSGWCEECGDAFTCIYKIPDVCPGHEEPRQCSECGSYLCENDCITCETTDEIICLVCFAEHSLGCRTCRETI